MELKYVCTVCGDKLPSPRRLGWHLRFEHDLSKIEYYDKYLKKDPNEGKCKQCRKPTNFGSIKEGYRDFCSVSCSRLYAEQNVKESDKYTVSCKICDMEFIGKNKLEASRLLSHHMSKHDLTAEEYYRKYIMKPGEDECLTCGTKTRYHGLLSGYESYCPNCSVLVNNAGTLGKAETEARRHKDKVLKEQQRIQDYYKRLYADDDVYDVKEKPHNVSQSMGPLTRNAIRKEADKYYVEVDTCDYNMPMETESVSMQPKRRYKDTNTEEKPGIIQWLINKIR